MACNMKKPACGAGRFSKLAVRGQKSTVRCLSLPGYG